LPNSSNAIQPVAGAGLTYTPDRSTLQARGPTAAKLLWLISFSNMNVAYDKIGGRRGTSPVVSDYGFPDQPMLDGITDVALHVLSKSPNGFILMAEGTSIDKQAHLMDSDRWMLEVLEFDGGSARRRSGQLSGSGIPQVHDRNGWLSRRSIGCRRDGYRRLRTVGRLIFTRERRR
jgi:alkaline phosphatase